MDGSLHDWFEGRRGKTSLMVMIDDATNWTYPVTFLSGSDIDLALVDKKDAPVNNGVYTVQITQ